MSFESIFNRPSSGVMDLKMNAPLDELDSLPEKVRANSSILSHAEKDLVMSLLSLGQHHLFASWDPPGTNDERKHAVIAQLNHLDRSCGGGLAGYISRARKLLAASRNGENPFDGWTPSVPSGVDLCPLDSEFRRLEEMGLKEVGAVSFVLVAGGLGERLGYNGIKVELPVETITKTSYLQLYCQQILAIQSRYGREGVQIPFAIMVSDDTEAKTVDLLKRNGYFGLESEQITILKQEKVPALMSNFAHIAMTGPYEIDAKPHGHGDVHYLLHTSGTAKKWLDAGVKWTVFFQDTNGLSLLTLPAMLGVSVDMNLEVNSMSVPRFAKQAVGAITKLTHKDGREMTINVEYNQLDPLLRATTHPNGDVNDPVTGHSPFPGNINLLLFRLKSYTEVLSETSGIMPEFVNPKYKDASKTVFKKPTRLECMMQDFPKLLSSAMKVGFTKAPSWLCYSPCKNNSIDAAASIAAGVPAAAPFTAECEQFGVVAQLLRVIGAHIEEGAELTILGVVAKPSPRIILHPSTALFPTEIALKFPLPDDIHISARSTLLLEGTVEVKALHLDGSLSVRANDNEKRIIVRVNKQADQITNDGHVLSKIDTTNMLEFAEVDRMRGYIIRDMEVRKIDVADVEMSQNSSGVFIYTGTRLVEREALEEEERKAAEDSVVPAPSGWFSCFNVDCF